MLRFHTLALCVAVLVGVISLAPHILFIGFLGDAYQGIPMMQTANEDSYLARIQEIVDGHGALGSPFFFEYKDSSPLSPPTVEWLYALPSIIFGISPATVLVTSKFILPTVLFFLVYLLVMRLTVSGGVSQRMNAIVGGLLVVLGYDLIDYRTVFSYINGIASPESFLLWARPVNPIFGAIFLMSFLIFVWEIIEHTKWRTSTLIGASLCLAFMFASYFFSWGIALSVLATLILFLLFRKEYQTAGTLASIIPLGIFFASPYWIAAWRAAASPWYEESVLRSGLFLTHYPLLNKLLLATLLVFVLTLVLDFFWKKRKGVLFRLEEWHWFCAALLLGGLWAYSQQILTGRTVWPYHFVQYTIPLSIVVGMVVAHRIVREYNKYIWAVLVSIAALLSLVFGVFTQVSTYRSSLPAYIKLQSEASLFRFLNAQEKDCVVFTKEDRPEMSRLNTLIPAFTHCNRYASTELFALMPSERGRDSYFALLRLNGLSADAVDEYLHQNRSEATGYLYSNWQGLFGVQDFPDFSDPLLEKRLKTFPEEYRQFMVKDFRTELKKYRLDYILSYGLLDEFPSTDIVYTQNERYLYRVK